MKLICKAYYLANSEQSLFRRFVILLIFLACGRAGEVALTFWSLITWNYITKNIFFNWSQTKTSKQKGVNILPDKDCFFMDFYHALGCLFMTKYFMKNRWDPENSEENVFLPTLVTYKVGTNVPNTGDTASKITSFISDLKIRKPLVAVLGSSQPKPQKVGTYAPFAVKELPEGAVGTSLRSGPLCELDIANIGIVEIARLSGHDTENICSVFEYLWVTFASTLLASMVLAGWLINNSGKFYERLYLKIIMFSS